MDIFDRLKDTKNIKNMYKFTRKLNPKDQDIILSIWSEKNIIEIAKKTQISYGIVIKKLKMFEEKGIVTTKKIGRYRKCNLTNRGKLLRCCLIQLLEVLR